MQSSGTSTSHDRSSASRAPQGSIPSPSVFPGFGRPRWLARMTRPPRSMTCLIVGMASRMRESSPIFPLWRGTLKSTRMKTRLFSTGSSRTVRMPSRRLVICAQSLLATSWLSSTIRLEKPHSLSYQLNTLAKCSPSTSVCVASKMDERGSPRKSLETSGAVS